MRYLLITIIFLFLFAGDINSQIINEIPFLQGQPAIDGSLKKELTNYPFQKFNYIEKSNNSNQDYDVRYKLAYGMDFFYIYIETDGDSLSYRDRGYQNGDGFHLVLALPKPNSEPSDEFYVLGFSAQKSESVFGRKIQWYRNINLEFITLGEEIKFVTKTENGKLIFELLIPWNNIYPYHPFLTKEIGFNLCFVKAVGEQEKNYYFIVNDQYIQWEQHKRIYTVLNFQKPALSTGSQGYLVLDRNHVYENENTTAKIVILSSGTSKNNFGIRFYTGENYLLKRESYTLLCNEGLNYFDKPINPAPMTEGGYSVKWVMNNIKFDGNIWLSVLKDFGKDEYDELVEEHKDILSQGSYNYLKFLINDISEDLRNARSYETSAQARVKINELTKLKESIINGEDIIKKRTGIFRRGFLSNLDTAYRPYSIKIPANFDLSKKYPLLVFLHGSGQDDRSLMYFSNSPDEFIELSPNGRGTSNCYSTNEALTDVKEAIFDVIANYPIDTSRIIIGGFSMGGYGAYRVYYEFPELFKAVAVISGHPDLANQWMGGEQISFLEEKNLGVFKKVPVFIFHGRQDLNCPFPLTVELVEKLKKAGVDVKFLIDDTGHGMAKEENRTEYYDWLRKIVSSD